MAPTAAPTDFFGKPYRPGGPDVPPAPIPGPPAAIKRTGTFAAPVDAPKPPAEKARPLPAPTNTSDWIRTGKSANPSTIEEVIGTRSLFPAQLQFPTLTSTGMPQWLSPITKPLSLTSSGMPP